MNVIVFHSLFYVRFELDPSPPVCAVIFACQLPDLHATCSSLVPNDHQTYLRSVTLAMLADKPQKTVRPFPSHDTNSPSELLFEFPIGSILVFPELKLSRV